MYWLILILQEDLDGDERTQGGKVRKRIVRQGEKEEDEEERDDDDDDDDWEWREK